MTPTILLLLAAASDPAPPQPSALPAEARKLADEGPGRELAMLKWGLVPFWADDTKLGRDMTNARSETVATKPAFRAAYKSRRCIVPVTGFCEYHGKRWHEFTLPDQPLFGIADLWERCTKCGDEPLETFTLLTTEANPLVAEYHPAGRMVVILDPDDYETWLSATPEKAALLLRSYPESKMAVAPLAVQA